jgi:hypothetical protein
VIGISLESDGLLRSASVFERTLEDRLREGFEMTLESIAARAKQTTTFVDRTGLLRQSIQSDGVTGGLNEPDGLVGTVSFGATSERTLRRKRGGSRRRMSGGAFYGVFLEYGTVHIKEKKFIRDAIDADDGMFIEDAVRAAFESAGFEVR